MKQLTMPIELGSDNYVSIEAVLDTALTRGSLISSSGKPNRILAFESVGDDEIDGGANEKTVSLVIQCSMVAVEKTSSVTFEPGEKVYFSTSTNKATATASDLLIGYAVQAIAANDESVYCTFDGTLSIP